MFELFFVDRFLKWPRFLQWFNIVIQNRFQPIISSSHVFTNPESKKPEFFHTAMRILERLGSLSRFDRSVDVNLKPISYFLAFLWLGF